MFCVKGRDLFARLRESERSLGSTNTTKIVVDTAKLEIVSNTTPGWKLVGEEQQKATKRAVLHIGTDAFHQHQRFRPVFGQPMLELWAPIFIEVQRQIFNVIEEP